MSRKSIIVGAVVAAAIVISVAFSSASSLDTTFSNTVRIGYFPNISHAQALVGAANGTFEQALGDTRVEYKIFNAGPASIEALFTDQVDIVYVGPNPAINGYIRTDGEGLRVIAGAASGGVLFVVRTDSGIDSAGDLYGKKLAAPQYGNTQDISLKSYIIENDLRLAEHGGSVYVLSAKSPDTVLLFLKKEIDGAWVPEPWGTILVKDAGGRIFLDERDLWPEGEFATTLVVARSEFLEEHPDLVGKVLEAHVETTLWINEHPEQAQEIVRAQLKNIMGQELPEDVIRDSFPTMEFTYRPMEFSLFEFAERAYDLGMLGREKPEIADIYYAATLNDVLLQKNLSIVE
ncbi:MAG: aliphatic sulfonate ABC transporter substrate-binding protein [Nitrososphaerales archaeon]